MDFYGYGSKKIAPVLHYSPVPSPDRTTMCCDRWTAGVFIGLSCRSAESPWKSRRSFEASAYISSWITIVTEKESLIIVLVKIHVKCDALNLIRRDFWHLKNPRSCTIIIVAHFPGHLTLHEYFIFSRFALGLTCSSICNNFTWTSIRSATRDPWPTCNMLICVSGQGSHPLDFDSCPW